MKKQTTLSGPAAICLAVCVALVIGGFCAQANAAFNQLSTQFITKAEDNDYEFVAKGPGNTDPANATIVEKGDYLIGAFEFPDFFNANTNVAYANFNLTTTMLTGVFVQEVLGVTGAGTTSAVFDLGVAPNAVWTGLGLPAPSAGTIVSLYDDPGTLLPVLDPTAIHLQGLVPPLTVGSGITNVTDGTLVAEFGFTGAAIGVPGQQAAVGGQFIQASTAADPGDRADDITQITTLTAFANMDATDGGFWFPHNFLGDNGFPLFQAGGPGMDTDHDLQLENTLGTGPSLAGTGWQIHTDTDAYVQRGVPEPLSAAVWLLLTTFGACTYRRRARLS